MCGDCNDTVLTACYEKALIVPVSRTYSFGVFSHCGDFSFIFLEVEIEVSFLIAEGQDWMSLWPLKPGDFVLLIFELELF